METNGDDLAEMKGEMNGLEDALISDDGGRRLLRHLRNLQTKEKEKPTDAKKRPPKKSGWSSGGSSDGGKVKGEGKERPVKRPTNADGTVKTKPGATNADGKVKTKPTGGKSIGPDKRGTKEKKLGAGEKKTDAEIAAAKEARKENLASDKAEFKKEMEAAKAEVKKQREAL